MWKLPAVLVVVVALVAGASVADRKCGECRPDRCEPPAEECLAGLMKDLCGCCYVCGRREGEVCDSDALPAPYRGRGAPCGEHLECRPRTDLAPGDPPEAMCVCAKSETLCGSDGRTYENECQLTEARYMQRDTGIRATHRGPCRSAPKIVSPPEEASNYTGGNTAMSCEATGWPIPVFEWRVDIGDGNTVPLPSDDPKVSVQTRGGPSKYEVTSWLQLSGIQPKDEATYWCIAKNEEGESSAAARVIVLDFKGNKVSDKGRSNDL